MPTIRVRDWTKDQIEQIREGESHASHDSVIKTLLKDRQLAQLAAETVDLSDEEADRETDVDSQKAFDDLTVLVELERADNGVVFLWCPNCATEIAHIGFEDQIAMSVFEIECQRCLVRLDQHAIVGIEIGYPIEERIIQETVTPDLQRCVIDYWDRSLAAAAVGEYDGEEIDDERLIWKYNEYLQEFGWTWPADVPVVGVESGQTYKNTATGNRIDVLESVSETRDGVDDYRVRRYTDEQSDGETTVLEAEELTNLLIGRTLSLADSDQRDTDAVSETE